jgi:hypothetical protein
MFYHLQYIHLFRPFLKYTPAASPLPAHVSPRRICTANAGAISKLMRLYKKTYNLRQICNIAVYMIHSACTIHMLNLPEKTAKRDIIHGIRHLEEIAEDWPCSRRTLCIISVLARKWGVDLPEEAAAILQRTDEKYGSFSTSDVPSPNRSNNSMGATPSPPSYPGSPPPPRASQEQFGPMGQYNQPTPPHVPLENMRLSPDILNGLAQQQQQQKQQQQQQQMPHQLVSAPPMSMGEALSAASAWSSMPAVTTQSMGGFGQQAFSPVVGAIDSGSRHVSSPSTTSTGYALDGQDWFLKDGVSWQQNFEAWSMAGGQAEAARASGSGMASPSIFMFQGLRAGGGDLDPQGFDAFGSMGNLDHLPGLD